MTKRIIMLLTATMLMIFLLFLCGCENKAEASLRQVKTELSELAPDDMKMTLYVLSPSILTRMPLTIDMLKSEQRESDEELDYYGIAPPLTVKELSWEEKDEICSFILEEIGPTNIVPVKYEVYMNARICFEIEDAKGEMILQLVFFADETDGYNRNIYWNGIELEYSPEFFRLIELAAKESCDLDGYFDIQGHVRGYGLAAE